VTAEMRSEEMVSLEEMAAMVATAAACWGQPRAEAMAARPVIPERAALAATLLADLAALAATAATVGRLMAAARLVAMAVPEFCLVMAALRAVTAARRSEEMAAAENFAAEDLAAM